MNARSLVAVVGWYGTAAIVLAYALVSFGALGSGSVAYQLLNLTGAVGVGISAYAKRAWQPVTLEIVWAAVAAVALLRAAFGA